jgi:hypothetical protein
MTFEDLLLWVVRASLIVVGIVLGYTIGKAERKKS